MQTFGINTQCSFLHNFFVLLYRFLMVMKEYQFEGLKHVLVQNGASWKFYWYNNVVYVHCLIEIDYHVLVLDVSRPTKSSVKRKESLYLLTRNRLKPTSFYHTCRIKSNGFRRRRSVVDAAVRESTKPLSRPLLTYTTGNSQLIPCWPVSNRIIRAKAKRTTYL